MADALTPEQRAELALPCCCTPLPPLDLHDMYCPARRREAIASAIRTAENEALEMAALIHVDAADRYAATGQMDDANRHQSWADRIRALKHPSATTGIAVPQEAAPPRSRVYDKDEVRAEIASARAAGHRIDPPTGMTVEAAIEAGFPIRIIECGSATTGEEGR